MILDRFSLFPVLSIIGLLVFAIGYLIIKLGGQKTWKGWLTLNSNLLSFQSKKHSFKLNLSKIKSIERLDNPFFKPELKFSTDNEFFFLIFNYVPDRKRFENLLNDNHLKVLKGKINET